MIRLINNIAATVFSCNNTKGKQLPLYLHGRGVFDLKTHSPRACRRFGGGRYNHRRETLITQQQERQYGAAMLDRCLSEGHGPATPRAQPTHSYRVNDPAWDTILHLITTRGPMSPPEIIRETGMPGSSVSAAINRGVKRGLVRKMYSYTHRRRYNLALLPGK